ncbi:MAG: hypothetical protein RLZ10_1900 [Bacteroidota bacterium]
MGYQLKLNTTLNPFKKSIILLTLTYGILIVLRGFLGIDFIPWHMSIAFADLITITNTADCNCVFNNPYLNGSCDPWGRLYNYPRIWLSVFSFLKLGKSSTIYIGFLYVIFFTFCASKLNLGRSNKSLLFIFVLLISPPVLLLLERGNNDVLVFSGIILTYYGIKANQNLPENLRLYLPIIIFFILGVLKLYPFILIITILFEKLTLTKKTAIMLLFVMLSCLYIFYIKDDLKLILKNTPNPSDMAYGRMVKFWIFNYSLELRHKISIILTSIVIMIALLTQFLFSKMQFAASDTINNSETWLFLCGASIYIGTFLIGNNYIYRIVFLLLCLPNLFSLVRQPKLRYFSIAILIMIALRFYFTTFEKYLPFKQQFLLDLSLSWGILFSTTTLVLFYTFKSIKLIENKSNIPYLEASKTSAII